MIWQRQVSSLVVCFDDTITSITWLRCLLLCIFSNCGCMIWVERVDVLSTMSFVSSSPRGVWGCILIKVLDQYLFLTPPPPVGCIRDSGILLYVRKWHVIVPCKNCVMLVYWFCFRIIIYFVNVAPSQTLVTFFQALVLKLSSFVLRCVSGSISAVDFSTLEPHRHCFMKGNLTVMPLL